MRRAFAPSAPALAPPQGTRALLRVCVGFVSVTVCRPRRLSYPNARIVRWQPVANEVKGKAGKALYYILDRFANGADEVPFAHVKKHVDVANAANFKKTIRRHPSVVEALAAEDIVEWPERRPRAYVKAFAASGFNIVNG